MNRTVRVALLVVALVAVLTFLALTIDVGARLRAPRNAGDGLALGASILAFLLAGVLVWALVGVGAWRASGAKETGTPDMHVTPAPAPPAVPDEISLESLREPITACPRCGFVGIRAAGMTDGVMAGGGELTKMSCPRCSYLGIPVEFAKRADYAEFLRELQAQ